MICRQDVNFGTPHAWLEASAVVQSISIGEPPEFRDHVVRGSDFFAADAHPRISFHSTRVEFAENGTATIDGVLDIRGIQRPVTAAETFPPPTKDPFETRGSGSHSKPSSTAGAGVDSTAARLDGIVRSDAAELTRGATRAAA